jgi:hypothetical protein
MTARGGDILAQNRVFAWIALATALVLLIPFLAMQFDWQSPDPGSSAEEVNWTLGDFVAAGALLFGTASLFVLAARRVPRNYRLPVGIACAAGLVYLWAELAVGVFTNLGS